MKIDFNKIAAELASEIKEHKDDHYRSAYMDGVMDYHNKMKKLEEK